MKSREQLLPNVRENVLDTERKLNNLRNASLWLCLAALSYARHSILIGFLWKFVGEKFLHVGQPLLHRPMRRLTVEASYVMEAC